MRVFLHQLQAQTMEGRFPPSKMAQAQTFSRKKLKFKSYLQILELDITYENISTEYILGMFTLWSLHHDGGAERAYA